MKMTNDLSVAVQGVYNSSREIMKNKQRHLYINMLDLLIRTTRASGVSSAVPLNEDYVKFWYSEILPLVFDEEKAIQENAITALETVLPYLESVDFQNLPEWPVIKAIIVDQYSKKLHDLRQASNLLWYKIWCLLVRILNKEILKGATVINTFLSIVEMGFRSGDYAIRADAFLCWKVLVEIFAKHNEIFSPKRIKLICIPLKSSQSKTLETSVNKFKVWWYFLSKLAPRIDEYLDIYESFLVYCFGPSCKQSNGANSSTSASSGQGKMYLKVKQMAIACLIESLGQPTKEVTCVLNSMGLDSLSNPLVGKNLMSKCSKMITTACVESTLMACDPEGKFGKQIEALWKNFNDRLVESADPELYYECFKQLGTIVENEKFAENTILSQGFTKIIDVLTSSKQIPFESEDSVNASKLSDALIQFLKVLSDSDSGLSNNTMENAAEMFSLKNLVQNQKYWLVQRNMITFIMSREKINGDFKLALWRTISSTLVDYLKHSLFEFRIADNAKIVNEWIMWPIQTQSKTDEPVLSDAQIFTIWKQLIEAASTAEGKEVFTEQMVGALRKVFESGTSNSMFANVFGSFILALDIEFDETNKPVAALKLVNEVISNAQKSSKQDYTFLVESLTTYLAKLPENQIILAFPELKVIFATIIEKEGSGTFAKHSVENFKRTLQDKLKSNKAKEKKLLKEIKDLIKNNSTYVIIPTVWSMNPEKLTEHQKEKMKEKRSDIPALYNDISQSQDTSIKPWTPKKIVIAKSKDSPGEIVIENNIEDRDSPIPLPDSDDNVETPSTVTRTDATHGEAAGSNDGSPRADSMQKDVGNRPENANASKDEKVGKSSEEKSNLGNKKRSKNIVLNESKKLLNKLNIQIDETNKKKVIRELKTIEIDTVEGNTVVKGRFRERRSIGGKDEANKKRRSLGAKRKRSDNSEDDQQASKKKDTKSSRKSLVFGSENLEKGEKLVKNDAKEKTDQAKQTNGSNESIDEVIEASQKSESVLAKKVTTRKSIGLTSNNNNTFMKPFPKNQIQNEALHTPQIISLSPQKENSSPNVEETIAETPINQGDLPPSDHKDKAETIFEIETEPNTEILDRSYNAQFLKPSDVSSTSVNNSPSSKVQMSTIASETADSLKASTSMKTASSNSKHLASERVLMNGQDTEPNTELQVNASAEKTSPSALSTVGQILQSEAGEKSNSITVDMNCSIRSSPECKDADERNSEFLNNTLNISPILSEAENATTVRTVIDQDKTPSSPVGRKSSRVGLQLPISPPERKSTNNTESPPTRPKHGTQFTGRGAQLINLIRNRRIENTPKPQNTLIMTAKTDDKLTEQMMQPPVPQASSLSPPKKDHITASTTQPSAPLQVPQISMHKDLLVFSKTLPSPYASPSASILKRKIRHDSLDESESPASKRKRVSFHDPPVSVTKEYVKFSEEDTVRPNLNRCLLPDRTSTPNNISTKNNSFKRKSRADSMLELANFSDKTEQHLNVVNGNRSVQFDQPSTEMDSLKWNNTSTDNCPADLDDRCLTPSPSLYFANEEAVLKHVMEKYQLETLFEKYMQNDKALTNKSVRTITNKICTLMKQDPKTKTNVLEILSEQHPREFLDHAIQENLSFVVCERLNYSSIVEFVCEKSKCNEDNRRTLLERIQSLLSVDKLTADAQQLLMTLLKNHRMSDQEIVACMKLIVDRQQENQQELSESV